ncbi:hypothetical protein ACFLXX_03430 [Chloroflexota bacterium]
MERAVEYLWGELLVRLLFCLGRRVSEALHIGVNNVDFQRGL